MVTTREMFEKILNDLGITGDVEASAVVSRDGLLMASNIPTGFRAETFAAMSATMLGAAETAISEFKKGTAERVIAESKETKIIACGAGTDAVLVVMARPTAGLGLVLVEMDKAAKKIGSILGGGPVAKATGNTEKAMM